MISSAVRELDGGSTTGRGNLTDVDRGGGGGRKVGFASGYLSSTAIVILSSCDGCLAGACEHGMCVRTCSLKCDLGMCVAPHVDQRHDV